MKTTVFIHTNDQQLLAARVCLDEGMVTRGFLRRAMRKHYLRKDAFSLLEGL